jgi:hypothetical protein
MKKPKYKGRYVLATGYPSKSFVADDGICMCAGLRASKSIKLKVPDYVLDDIDTHKYRLVLERIK